MSVSITLYTNFSKISIVTCVCVCEWCVCGCLCVCVWFGFICVAFGIWTFGWLLITALADRFYLLNTCQAWHSWHAPLPLLSALLALPLYLLCDKFVKKCLTIELKKGGRLGAWQGQRKRVCGKDIDAFLQLWSIGQLSSLSLSRFIHMFILRWTNLINFFSLLLLLLSMSIAIKLQSSVNNFN